MGGVDSTSGSALFKSGFFRRSKRSSETHPLFVATNFSRQREFRAETGAAEVAGRDKIIGTLEETRGRGKTACAAGSDGSTWHFWQYGCRDQAAVHDPSATGGANCRAAPEPVRTALPN